MFCLPSDGIATENPAHNTTSQCFISPYGTLAAVYVGRDVMAVITGNNELAVGGV
jgi:hypothetical protein